jgi:hypothetical protein
VLNRSLSSVSVCETTARMSRSVWAAVSPMRLRLVFHRFGSYDPLMLIVKVNIATSHPGRNPASRFRSGGVLHSLVCVSVLEGESTQVIWPRELQDEEVQFVPTYRPGVGPLPSECCVSIDCFTLTTLLDACLPSHPRPAAMRSFDPLAAAGPGGSPQSVLLQWSILWRHPLCPLHSRCAMLWWVLGGEG